jgi:hypothetical protein
MNQTSYGGRLRFYVVKVHTLTKRPYVLLVGCGERSFREGWDKVGTGQGRKMVMLIGWGL